MGSVVFLPHSLFDEKVIVLAPKDCMNNYIGNISKLNESNDNSCAEILCGIYFALYVAKLDSSPVLVI